MIMRTNYNSLIQEHVLNILQELLVNLLIDVLKDLSSIHNAHIHSSQAGMVKEGRVEGPANRLIASETKSNVGDPPAYLGSWADTLDLPRGANEVHSIVVVLR
jgi:hypothetical protein